MASDLSEGAKRRRLAPSAISLLISVLCRPSAPASVGRRSGVKVSVDTGDADKAARQDGQGGHQTVTDDVSFSVNQRAHELPLVKRAGVPSATGWT